MPDSNAEQIAKGLTEARNGFADLTYRWDCISDADPLDCDYDEYIQRMEVAGYMECMPVTEQALEEAFADERGIYPGGMMYQLTDLGRSIRRILTEQSARSEAERAG